MDNKETNKDLSIIIVSWNVKDKLKDNLNALFKSHDNTWFEVFVVDNNSSDGTALMIKQEFPQVKMIANQENLGFAKACNQGIKQAQGDFILLLNPDMKVFPDALGKMVEWMKQNKQAWVAGCHLVDEQDNTVKHARRFPAIWDQLAIVLKLPHLLPGILNKYLRKDFDYSKFVGVDSIRGGFFMTRSEVIKKIGMLDERYFLWFEEVDYCKRVKQAGGEVWYTPDAKCIDYVGQSFKQLSQGKAQKYFRSSQLKYFKKWQPVWQYWLLKLAWPAGLFIAWLGERLKIKSKVKT